MPKAPALASDFSWRIDSAGANIGSLSAGRAPDMDTDSILMSIAMLKEVIAGKTYDAVAAEHGVTRTAIERRIKALALRLSREVGIDGINDEGVAFVQRLRSCRSAILAALERYAPQASQERRTGRLLTEDNARRLREGLFGQDVSKAAIEDHVSVLGSREAIEAALAWYRSNKGLSGDFGPIRVPTLYIWGDADATDGPDAAKGTGAFVTAAYGMEVLPGVGHFVMDQAAARTTELMLAHLARHPV